MELEHNFRLVCTTVDSEQKAKTLATTIISEKLAFCCSISNAGLSVYMWNNVLTEASEFTLTFKTFSSLEKPLADRLKTLHDYEIPEIIGIDAYFLHQQYEDWANDIRI